eukprot:TRINITY_DN53965_c0_g1_i1.p1 TRINITY_DN53965_c0_g1~~TRINITY_DN53965_c0_g1_i1.p1  ORF type:complete len:422 (+),score=213.50 TRINITY_DN53965_c0_g1_i1:52-1317(+)
MSTTTDTNTNNTETKKRLTRIETGHASEVGMRPTMEDEVRVVERHEVANAGSSSLKGPLFFAGVYDGHAGDAAAKFTGKRLHEVVFELVEEGVEVEQALVQAFERTDEEFFAQASEMEKTAGSTVAVALVDFASQTLWTAHAGDARVTVRRGESETLSPTKDHKASSEAERRRIMDRGGFVVFGRVMGELAIARAIGDGEFKLPSSEIVKEIIKSHREENPEMYKQLKAKEDNDTSASASAAESKSDQDDAAAAAPQQQDHTEDEEEEAAGVAATLGPAPSGAATVTAASSTSTAADTTEQTSEQNKNVDADEAKKSSGGGGGGESKHKLNARLEDIGKLVIATPDVSKIQLQEQDSLMIVACDGLFDVLSNDDALSALSMHLAATSGDLNQATAQLVRDAIDKHGSRDNVSVVAARFVWE